MIKRNLLWQEAIVRLHKSRQSMASARGKIIRWNIECCHLKNSEWIQDSLDEKKITYQNK